MTTSTECPMPSAERQLGLREPCEHRNVTEDRELTPVPAPRVNGRRGRRGAALAWAVASFPLLFLWALLLFAPRSDTVPLGERVLAGAVVSTLGPLLMWVKSRR